MTTKTAKHTPGPWSALVDEIQSADGHTVAIVTGGDGATYYDSDINAECAANMRLLVAAPNLLRIAEKLMGSYDAGHLIYSWGVDGGNKQMEMLRDAIAKATNG